MSLILMAALLPLAPPSAATELTTLTGASGAFTNQTLAMDGCGQSVVVNFTLPFDARVQWLILDIDDSGTAANATGTISQDIGHDGSRERTDVFEGLMAPSSNRGRFNVDGAGLTQFIAGQRPRESGNTSDVVVPISIEPCISVSAWNMTVRLIEVGYYSGGPSLTVPIPDVVMLRGENLPQWSGSIPEPNPGNLTHHFEGTWVWFGNAPPPFVHHWSFERFDAGLPSAGAVTIENGWQSTPEWAPETLGANDTREYLNITSTGTWTGTLTFRVLVTDYWNRTGVSNNITLCVKASETDACAANPAPVPRAPPRITTGGQTPSVVEAGVPTTFDLALATPLPPNATVQWYVDGVLVGNGARLDGVVLPEGAHVVEARIVDGADIQTLRISVKARPPGPLGALPLLTDFSEPERVGLLLGVATLGVFFTRSPGARFRVGWLLVGAFITRSRREALLDHFVRGRLYQVIVENPGIHFSELRRRTGVGNGNALYHLSVLEKGGFIRVRVESSKTHFYATDQALDRTSYGLNTLDKAIIEAVGKSPGISQKDLSRTLGRSPSIVSRTVRRLSGFGYVSTEREGREVSVFLRETAPVSPFRPVEDEA